MLETLENCRIGRIRASIHVKNFPLSAFKVTQRVPIIEIVCEANCDNLTLVRPSFVYGRVTRRVFFFPPISTLFFFLVQKSITIIPIVTESVRLARGERERERGAKSWKYLQSRPRRGTLYRASFASLNAADREREPLIGRVGRNLGLISGSGIAHESATVRQETFRTGLIAASFDNRPLVELELLFPLPPPLVVFLFERVRVSKREPRRKRSVKFLENRATSRGIPRWTNFACRRDSFASSSIAS